MTNKKNNKIFTNILLPVQYRLKQDNPLLKSNIIIYDKLNIKTYLCKLIRMKVSLKRVRIVLFVDIILTKNISIRFIAGNKV